MKTLRVQSHPSVTYGNKGASLTSVPALSQVMSLSCPVVLSYMS